MDRHEVELVHSTGNTFKVLLSTFELNQANNEPEFADQLLEKYYGLFKKGLIRSTSQASSSNIEGENTQSTVAESMKETHDIHMWTMESTRLMLQLRLSKEDEFNKPSSKKIKLWNAIAYEMKEIGSYEVSGTDCYSKYRNLLQTYRNNKEKRLKKTGESKINWEFYEMMDAVLGCKAASAPPLETLSSSLRESTDCAKENDIAKASDDEVELPELSQQSQRKRTKVSTKLSSKNELTLQQYLYLKNEKDNLRWEEQKKLKEKEIEALKYLADAIRCRSRDDKDE